MFTTEKAPGELHEQPHRELLPEEKLLLKAADYITEHGLSSSGKGYDMDGRVCVIVALGICGLDYPSIDGAIERLRRHVPLGIADWSDNNPAAEVVAKLRAVALGG